MRFSENYKCQFYNIGNSNLGKTILCIAYDNKAPISLGVSLEKDTSDGITKSLLEAIRNFSVYVNDKNYFYKKIQNNSDLWSCDPAFLKVVVENTKNNSGIKINDSVPRTQTSSKKVSEILNIDSCPLYFACTESVGV